MTKNIKTLNIGSVSMQYDSTLIPERGSSAYLAMKQDAEKSLQMGSATLDVIGNFVPLDDLVSGRLTKQQLKDYYRKDRWNSTAVLAIVPQLISVIQIYRGVKIGQVAPSLILAFYNRYFHLEEDQLVDTFSAFKGLYRIEDEDGDGQLSTTSEVISLVGLVLQVIAAKNPKVKDAAEGTSKFTRIIGQISALLPIVLSVISAIFKKHKQ